MRTLIKWPGGKSKEFKHFKDLIPPHERYIEPFFGGGAVFFHLQPERALINDIAEELMHFYMFIKGEKDSEVFRKEVYAYVDNWEKIPKYISLFRDAFMRLYKKYKSGAINKKELNNLINKEIEGQEDNFNGLFLRSFCIDDKNLARQIAANLTSKIHRTVEVENKKGKLSEKDVYKNIETAFRSGFYMHFRDLMNLSGDKYRISPPKKIANYYFIREFCYGSMFRFNSQGHFNIPYGGIAYNSKNFRSKVDYIFSDEVKDVLANTELKIGDFEDILKKNKLTRKDFMFLDPPYDTDFSDYEKKSFDKQDQERLARCLYKTHANFILIIKNTPFIYKLYSNKKGLHIDKFEKKYLYNMRGRNKRDVEHLIVYNF